MSRPGVHLTTVAVERPYDLRGSFHRNPLRAAVRPRLACHSLAETQSRSAGKDSAEAAGSGRRATHGGRCVKRRDTDGGAASSVSRTVFGRNRSIYARDTDEKGVSSVSRRENGMKAGGHFGFQPTVRVVNYTYERDPMLRNDFQLRSHDGSRLFSDLLTIIPLQLPCLKAETVAECRKSYEVLLFLLKSMSRRMKTKQELLDEVNGMNLPEEMKVVFRRVINTVESELTDDQWRDYELDLDKYQRTMSEYRTARQMGREEGIRQTARAMKENGLPPELIKNCTGLTFEEIQEL